MAPKTSIPTDFAGRLLRWYRANKLNHPWRRTTDPYSVWVSEILLQQTRIPVARKYYEKILLRYPTIETLSMADPREFLSLWSGAGYYRRAASMLDCAERIVRDFDGRFPATYQDLRQLPGIGKYTAGAILNISFGILTPAIDGNIRRVLSRIMNLQPSAAFSEVENRLSELFITLAPKANSSDYFQGLMELGETICLPVPRCSLCPVKQDCRARKAGTADLHPAKRKKQRSENLYWYFLILEKNGRNYFVKNNDREFLKEAWLFPDLLAARRLKLPEILESFRSVWGLPISDARLDQSNCSHAVTSLTLPSPFPHPSLTLPSPSPDHLSCATVIFIGGGRGELPATFRSSR